MCMGEGRRDHREGQGSDTGQSLQEDSDISDWSQDPKPARALLDQQKRRWVDQGQRPLH